MLRFAGFELDQQRVELRGPDGAAVPLRPKTFDLLWLLSSKPGQVLSKSELMAAVWPNVHVGEDSLFQCIRELRLALGDERRRLIKVVSGRGYLLDTVVEDSEAAASATPAGATVAAPSAPRRRPIAWFAAAAAAIAVVAGLAYSVWPPSGGTAAPTIAVLAIGARPDDAAAGQSATDVTNRLRDGLARIANIEVLAGPAPNADFVVSATLDRTGAGWEIQARLTGGTRNEVLWTRTASVPDSSDTPVLTRSRLAAAIGHDLAVSLNALLLPDAARGVDPVAATSKVVIEQATAHINQTSIERFRAAQQMLEDGLKADPGNVELQAALAAHLMRGVQMSWYGAEGDAAKDRARALLEHALSLRPNSLPVQEAYCRFLTSTNQFSESLVACARALTLDPWNGIALYHLGLTQLQLGRFDDALASFKQADQYDTPEVSRWTWTLGVGWTYILMGDGAAALPWLERAIAITPASGRPYFLLAAAYQDVGRLDDARAAMAKGLALRPGSSALNVGNATENASPVFLAAVAKLTQLGIAAGLPER